MKKIITTLCIFALFFTHSNVIAEVATPSVNIKNVVLYEYRIKKYDNGQNYINAIDSFISANKNNTTFLKSLKSNLEKVVKNGNLNSNLNNDLLIYLYSKISITLEPNVVTINNSTPSVNVSSTNSNSGKVNTYSSGALVVKIIYNPTDIYGRADDIIEDLQSYPSLKNAYFETIQYTADGIATYLNENNLTTIPAIIFSNNNIDTSKDPQYVNEYYENLPKLDQKLTKLNSGEYVLAYNNDVDEVSSNVSGRGYPVLSKSEIEKVKKYTFVDGGENTKFSWIEYGNIQCPSCAKLYNDGTYKSLKSRYFNDLNYYFIHFPLDNSTNSQKGAETLECLGYQKGANAFFNMMYRVYKDGASNREYLVDEAERLGANRETLIQCIDSDGFANKIISQKQLGQQLFGISTAVSVVILNNYTGEYQVIIGDQSLEKYEQAIDKLK